jgi:hypothetical protein
MNILENINELVEEIRNRSGISIAKRLRKMKKEKKLDKEVIGDAKRIIRQDQKSTDDSSRWAKRWK